MPSAPMNEERLSTAGSAESPSPVPAASAPWRERDGFRRLRDALDHAGILHREKSLGDDDVEKYGQNQRAQSHKQCDGLIAQDELQRPPVERDHAFENALRGFVEASLLLLGLVAQDARGTSSESASAIPPPK